MSTSYWLSYDAREDRRRPRRKWPWFLLALLFAALAIGLVAMAMSDDGSESVDFTQPVAIQTALPALLTDNSQVVYVVDDSGSLNFYLADLRQAVRDVSQKAIENSEVALMLHGDYPTVVLFDFTTPENIPWEIAVQSVTALSATEWMYRALDEARQMLLNEPDCYEKPKFLFFNQTECWQKTIVMIGDGNTFDPEIGETVMTALHRSNVTVHTIYLGDGNEAAMRAIAALTEGQFVRVH